MIKGVSNWFWQNRKESPHNEYVASLGPQNFFDVKVQTKTLSKKNNFFSGKQKFVIDYTFPISFFLSFYIDLLILPQWPSIHRTTLTIFAFAKSPFCENNRTCFEKLFITSKTELRLKALTAHGYSKKNVTNLNCMKRALKPENSKYIPVVQLSVQVLQKKIIFETKRHFLMKNQVPRLKCNVLKK